MYAIYCRLNAHVSDSNLSVIKAASLKLKNRFDQNPETKKRRKDFYRAMLQEHKEARDLFVKYRF